MRETQAPSSPPVCERQAARRMLGVPCAAGPREVEQRFRRLAHRLHPDRGGDPVVFRQLLEARAVLTRPTTRRHVALPPLVVVHRGPWWRRFPRALARTAGARINPPARRVQ